MLFRSDKRRLRDKLSALSLELDRYLARDYGIDPNKAKAFAAWRESHQPLHWFAEFYGVMREGGFDVVIGNPPYVATRKITGYTVLGYKTAACTDIYAWCLERVIDIASKKAWTGMIVPLSLSFSGDFGDLRQMLYERYQGNWFSHFAKRPSMLFSGVQVRNAIHIGHVGGGTEKSFTTKLHRWHSEARSHLFNQLCYSEFRVNSWTCIPKAQGDALLRLFESKNASSQRLHSVFSRRPTNFPIYFKKIGYNWISFGEFIPPAYDPKGRLIAQNEFGVAYVNSNSERQLALLLLNGRIAFTFWILVGDDFHLTKGNFAELPFDFSKISKVAKNELARLAVELSVQMKESIVFMNMHGKRLGNFNATLCRSITAQSDRIFANEFGLTPIWDEFDLLHSQIVRSAAEGEDEDE